MITHAPEGYACPFCEVASNGFDRLTSREDVIFEDASTLAFIAPTQWKNCEGGAIVIPKPHYENIYDIEPEALATVHKTAQKVVIAMKQAYGCDGVSARQHNEPAGNQDVWHFHVHVTPRYEGDNLYQNYDDHYASTPEQRLPYAQKLRAALQK